MKAEKLLCPLCVLFLELIANHMFSLQRRGVEAHSKEMTDMAD
jgi:hypothetical protein